MWKQSRPGFAPDRGPPSTQDSTAITQDMPLQSSLGGGSRFLKKAPTSTDSNQSAVSKNKVLQEPSRSVSSLRSSRAAFRLSEIESQIRGRKQALEQTRQESKTGPTLTSRLGISQPAAVRSTNEQLSADSNTTQNQRGNRFLKKKSAGLVESTTATAVAPKAADRLNLRTRTSDHVVFSTDLETKPRRTASDDSLESDEEYMKNLLGDLTDSADLSFSGPRKTSPIEKMLTPSQRVQSPAQLTAVHPSSPFIVAPTHSSASPSRCSSPFRFASKTPAPFSPSGLSPLPSPPTASPLPVNRMDSSHSLETSQRSALSLSGREKVLSLEELFLVGPASEDPQSQRSSISSEDFKMNVMTVDELFPATAGLTSETPGKESQSEHEDLVSGSQNKHRLLLQEEEEQEEEVLDYQSDFESVSSLSRVSEYIQGGGNEGAAPSLVRQEASGSRGPHEQTEDKYSSVSSDPRCFSTSQISDHSQKSMLQNRSTELRSSTSPSIRSSSFKSSRRGTSARKALKDAAVQTRLDPLTESWSTGMAPLNPTVDRRYTNPPPVVTHSISAERLEAICMYDSAGFALSEMLKQQLTMTRLFIDSSEHLHSCLVRSLEPPNYRYTTLKDTIQSIKNRPSKLTMDKVSR